MRGVWILVVALAGCTAGDGTTKTDGVLPTDDTTPHETGETTPPDHTGITTTTTEEGFCAVRQVFNRNCVVCHSSAAPQGNLDLQTDPYAAVVGVTSLAYGQVLVQPNDHAGSLLWRKMDASQAAGEGDPMPPPSGASPTDVQVVQDWIDDGAPETCGTGGTTPPGAYHPKGWDAPEVHGMATKFQTETDCRSCHGSDLSGGSSGVSCTSCHGAGWETDCTFCHGGVLSTTGAPPEDIDDNDDPATISFVPHEVHGGGRISPAFDCVVCHDKPTDALTPGHLFDDPTAGEAEVVFNVAPGAYDGTNRCSNLYCHGNGLGNNGAVNADAAPRTCHSCHPDRTTPAKWSQMSGHHSRHLNEGFDCEECHADAQGSTAIDIPGIHVNGTPNVSLPGGISYNAQSQRCDGTCHGERHNSRGW